MKKLISAASAIAMAASMLGTAAMPFVTSAADSTKGFALRAFDGKDGNPVSTTISEDEIKAGDVTIPIGVYLVENSNDSLSISSQWTINSKDGDASNTNITFKAYKPGVEYFNSEKSYTLSDGSSGSTSAIVGFSGTISSSRDGDEFIETSAGTFFVADKQDSVEAPNAWGSIMWLPPATGEGYQWSGAKSDDYPMFVFEATFKKGTPAGTYTIDFIDYATQASVNPEISCSMIEGLGGKKYTKGNGNLTFESIDIVIGGATQSTTTTEGTTTTTKTTTTTTKTDGTTTTTTKKQDDDNGLVTMTAQTTSDPNIGIQSDFIVKGSDYEVEPGGTIDYVDFIVDNSGNHLGATFVAELADLPAGITATCYTNESIAAVKAAAGKKYYEEIDGSYQVHVINDEGDPVAVESDKSIICFKFTVPADAKPGKYEYGLKKFRVVEHAQIPVVLFDATLVPGTITILGDVDDGSTTTTESTTTTKTTTKTESTTTTKTTTKDSGNTTTTKQVGNVLYGDTNVDGKVNIADVVVLNKWLNDASSYAMQDQGKVNADCCDAKGGEGLDKNDSDAIIKSIVHLVTLPCAASDLK